MEFVQRAGISHPRAMYLATLLDVLSWQSAVDDAVSALHAVVGREGRGEGRWFNAVLSMVLCSMSRPLA
jgi:hypothetical protein